MVSLISIYAFEEMQQHIAVLCILILFTLSLRISIADHDCSSGNHGSKFASKIVVEKSGNEDHNSVQSAIDSIPPNNYHWIKVHINPGVYTEKVTIPRDKPCIVLEGQGRGVTVITYNAHDKTDTSSTFTFVADNIVAKGITFMNSYNHQLQLQQRVSSSQGPILQAVAARVLGDKSAFFECGFVGLQDTLWDALGRHYFYNCYIEGAADFIFGSGQSFYENCSINVTAGAFASRLPRGYITAQGRQSSDDQSGFVFNQGKIFGTLQTYLGRAYGPHSRVIFLETTENADIVPQGWDAWKYPGKEENFMYAEVNCQGPGSNTSGRVPWAKKQLTQSQLQQFSRSSFIDSDGWIGKLPP